MIKNLSCFELKELFASKEPFQLIDVREPEEYEYCNIEGAILIPLSEIKLHVDKVNKNGKVVVYCHHGIRSANAINMLENLYGFENLYNLKGGIHSWSIEIDSKIRTY